MQLIVLAIVQGVTEFLPVSSSAHLALVPLLSDWPDQGLSLDVAAHFGSLLALLGYFRRELRRGLAAWLAAPAEEGAQQNATRQLRRLPGYVLLGSIPVLAVGYLSRDYVAVHLRDVQLIAWASILFGLLLWWADQQGRQTRALSTLRLPDALLIGLAQTLALVPGASRAGVTITAALLLGFQRGAAARLSIFLAVPVILAVSAHESLHLWQAGSEMALVQFVLVAVLSCASAWLVLHLFLRFLQRIGLLPFVVYRVLLGLCLIVWGL